jgi:hypothetical protein
MHSRVPARRLAAIAVVTLLGVLAFANAANAAQVTPEDFTCGVTVFDQPCNQTAHLSELVQVGTPLAPSSSCAAFVSSDFVLIVAEGNGIEHAIINDALDGWFTTTFTGDATITAYLGDPSAGGTPDPAVPQYGGKITEWFGGSFNHSNFVTHSTIHVDATASDGSGLHLSDVFHLNSAAGSVAPPHFFEFAHCN